MTDSPTAPASLRLYYDVVCPFAYLAFLQLPRLRAHADVELCPVLLGGLLRHAGGPDDPNAVMAPPRAVINRRDIELWASMWDVPLHIPQAHPRRSVDAMRVLVAAPAALRETLTGALYEAYWQAGDDITDHAVLEAIVAPHGLELGALLQEGRDALRTATAAAHAEGVFAVPTVTGGPRMIWGQDRLGLLLMDLGLDLDVDAWVCPPTTSPAPAITALHVFHDFSSPFSYLASTQIERIAAAHEVADKVRWTPILLGAVFRAIGTADVPLHAMHEAKQAYVQRDLTDWAAARSVPFGFRTSFPLRSVLALRAALVEPAATAAIYAAAWVDDRAIDEPAELAAVLSEAGFAGEEIVAATADPAVKSALRQNTETAVALGLCGVPTVVLEREGVAPLVLWGQDRLVMLRAALRGWVPAPAGGAPR